jgi:hypothetical protein
MTSKCDKRAVVGMWLIVILLEGRATVVKPGRVYARIDFAKTLHTHHLPNVPQLHGLIFPVAEHIAAVPLTIDVSETLGMTKKDTCGTAVAHGAAIPYFEGSVIRAREKDMRRRLVAKTDCIDIVAMTADSESGLPGFKVVNIYGFIGCSCNKFTAVSGKANGPYLLSR